MLSAPLVPQTAILTAARFCYQSLKFIARNDLLIKSKAKA
jgi:hypothetical protein